MNMKPIIGVMPLWDEEKKSIWMLPGYMNGIIDAGGIPMVLLFTDNEDVFCRALDICSGFLLTGGQDVDPMIYGERKRYDNIVTCTLRDKLDAIVLNKAVELDKASAWNMQRYPIYECCIRRNSVSGYSFRNRNFSNTSPDAAV